MKFYEYKVHICMLLVLHAFGYDNVLLTWPELCFVGTCKSIHTALFVLAVRAFEGRAMRRRELQVDCHDISEMTSCTLPLFKASL